MLNFRLIWKSLKHKHTQHTRKTPKSEFKKQNQQTNKHQYKAENLRCHCRYNIYTQPEMDVPRFCISVRNYEKHLGYPSLK